jgi:hypothetical protein
VLLLSLAPALHRIAATQSLAVLGSLEILQQFKTVKRLAKMIPFPASPVKVPA